MKILRLLSIVLVVTLVFSVNSWGWWDKTTHRILTGYAADKFFPPEILTGDLLSEGVTHTAKVWLQEGSTLEDESNLVGYPTRSLNHFHDPTKLLEKAGLNDTFSGMSAIIWAQNPSGQKDYVGGDWSWQKVRGLQYNYLLSLSETGEDANLAQLLKGLGYQMHLLQDMSQPNHVRNDTQIFDGIGWKGKNGFESTIRLFRMISMVRFSILERQAVPLLAISSRHLAAISLDWH
jgi:hypothetical protein